ncbi:MAG: cysteine desulfurase NifS [Proteobacteria bacterium]|nr:cysteine desulfurase NifS [Pseudomonadota bacterium]
MKQIYLDNNATTRVWPEVVEAMLPYFGEIYFNPSSMYECAKEAASALEGSRERVARYLGAAHASEILFTSCATESNSTAIRGAAWANPRRRHIVTSAVEHPAVLSLCEELEREGYEVDRIGVNALGEIDVKGFVRALRPGETLVVSLMHANNETGVLFPIERLSSVVKATDAGILFHTDATQTVGKLPIDLTHQLKGVDFLSFSGHKFHGPKGVGGLYIRKGTACRPFLYGGHQENGRRGGTENIPYIVGLARACEIAQANAADVSRLAALRARLEEGLKRIPYVVINGEGAERLPTTTNAAFHCIEGEGILYQLDVAGICASSGSACTSGSLEPSHVLRAMGVPFTAVHGSIRFSMSHETTASDIDRVLEVMPGIVASLRKLSPYWDREKNCPRREALIVER